MDALERYGRQILVDDVTLSQQMSLAQWSIAPSSDGSSCAHRILEASTQYLVGAGIGRLVAEGALASDAAALDGRLKVGLDERDPPVIHLYAASRSYGLSVDLLVTASARDWQRADADDAFVSTLIFDLGQPAQEHHGVELGATVAEVIVNALLEIEPWPAVLRCRWQGNDPVPKVIRLEPVSDDHDASKQRAPAGLLAELRGETHLLAQVHQDCETHYPNEACGLLLRDQAGQLEVLPCVNLQDRYHELDPEMYPRTARAAFKLNERKIVRAQEQGKQLVGIYHSHCEAGAYFSAEDVRSAAPEGEPLFPGVGNLVVSVLQGRVAAEAMFHFSVEHSAFLRECD